MITIFGVPKPFEGHYNIIQKNAIRSWLKLRPECEVILLGNDKGIAEAAADFGIKHIPDVALSKFGTPLVPDVFDKVIRIARYPALAYLNSDIILFNDFMEAFSKLKKPLFLMGGQRTDVDIKESIDFEDPNWEKNIRILAEKRGQLHGPAGMDYFVFQKSIPFNFPENFAAGRPGGDNWTVYRARFLKVPVIDTTQAVLAVHQNHPHSYLQGANNLWEGPESQENRKAAGGYKYAFNLNDADFILTKKGLKRPKLTTQWLARYFETLPVLHPAIGAWPKIISFAFQPKRVAKAFFRRIKLIF